MLINEDLIGFFEHKEMPNVILMWWKFTYISMVAMHFRNIILTITPVSTYVSLLSTLNIKERKVLIRKGYDMASRSLVYNTGSFSSERWVLKQGNPDRKM